MAGSILGTEVVRREDGTLLTGEGHYTGDLRPEGLLTAYFVRSPVAHAVIRGIDIGAAAEHPGVAGVFTAANIGVEQVKPRFPLDPHFARGPLAGERVRFVGEPVVMVVADTLAVAQDAADEIMVDYEPLPVSMDAEAAVLSGEAVLFPERGSDSMVRDVRPGGGPARRGRPDRHRPHRPQPDGGGPDGDRRGAGRSHGGPAHPVGVHPGSPSHPRRHRRVAGPGP